MQNSGFGKNFTYIVDHKREIKIRKRVMRISCEMFTGYTHQFIEILKMER